MIKKYIVHLLTNVKTREGIISLIKSSALSLFKLVTGESLCS